MVLEGMDNPPSYEDSLKHAASQASRARTWATRNNFFLTGDSVGQSRGEVATRLLLEMNHEVRHNCFNISH